jgi:hypothetical protein
MRTNSDLDRVEHRYEYTTDHHRVRRAVATRGQLGGDRPTSITRKIDAMVQKRSLTVLKTVENFGWIGRSCPKSFGVLGA